MVNIIRDKYLYKLGNLLSYQLQILIILIFCIALFLRLYGLDWDNKTLFHPDERALLMQVNNLHLPQLSNWTDLFKPEISTLHPGSFNWGSFPHYLLKSIQYLLSPFKWLDIYELRFPGRIIMAISDIITISFIYLICKENFSRRIAILASIFACFSVIHIQLSHFFAVDILMTTLIVGTIYFCLRIVRESKISNSIFVGIVFGLALATKFSVLPLIIPILLAHIISANNFGKKTLEWNNEINYLTISKRLLIFLFSILVTLILFQPYMFLDFSSYLSDIFTQSSMVSMNVDWPFTRQYIDTPKYFYQIFQLSKWGLGPILGIICWISLVHILIDSFLYKRKVELIILSWVVPYFLITGWFDVKFLRYMLPLVPFLLIFASRSLFLFYEKSINWNKIFRLAPIALVLITTIHYSFAFVSIYSEPHPSVLASEWLKENTKNGDKILQEHWDEGLPKISGLQMHERLEMYNPDSIKKFSKITNQLEDSDFLVLITNRLYGTIPRLPERYPISTNFYSLLFQEKLGYELVYDHSKSSSFLGFTYFEDPFARISLDKPKLNNQSSGLVFKGMGWADESFNVYDHPQIMIFKNIDLISNEKLMQLLEVGKLYDQLKEFENISPMTFSENQFEIQKKNGDWSKIFYLKNNHEIISVLLWYMVLQMLGFLVLPIVFRLFGQLPDKGYLFSKIIGLTLTSYVSWVIVSLGLVRFNLSSILLSIFILLLFSIVFLWGKISEISHWLVNNKRRIFIWEFLFILLFLLFLLLRAYNPDLWHPFRGGEKPMDFAYLNAIVKSSILPPYDPWYSGGYMNYYYFGQFMVANLIKLTGIVPSISYNLSLATFFSLSAVAVFSVLLNFIYLSKKSYGFPFWSNKLPWGISIVSILFVLIFGNIDGLIQFSGIISDYFTGEQIRSFDFWRSSRMMSSDSLGFEITEFPFFTFLFADLHAHLLVIPIYITAIFFLFSHYLSIGKRENQLIKYSRIFLLGILCGAVWITNTWNYPTIVFLSFVVILGGELLFGYGYILQRIIRGFFTVCLFLFVSYIFFYPFHTSFELFNNGILISDYQTDLFRFLGIHFFFLFIITSWIVMNYVIYVPDKFRNKFFIIPSINSINKNLWIFAVFILVIVLILRILSFQWTTLIFLSFFSIFFIWSFFLIYKNQPAKSRYTFVFSSMVFVALCIAIGVEILTIKGDIGRMNTVFKFYLQVWILLSLSSGYFLWEILDRKGDLKNLKLYSQIKYLWVSALFIFCLSSIFYPIYAIPDRNSDRFIQTPLTINGSEYMKNAVCISHCYPSQDKLLYLKDDFLAIEWLKNHVKGSPVIVEGVTDLYMWGSRISVNTGLPTVIGWDWHQKQQRSDYSKYIDMRNFELKNFYFTGSTDKALTFLDKYNVKYVIVGELERKIYSKVGILKFDKMEQFGLKKVYSSNDLSTKSTIIYEYK
ncbi:MAG: hypothetical protein CL780_04545 [Chloroflexi bacterium]|nr:hypothetical protein [Chloroflexota bacterium]